MTIMTTINNPVTLKTVPFDAISISKATRAIGVAGAPIYNLTYQPKYFELFYYFDPSPKAGLGKRWNRLRVAINPEKLYLWDTCFAEEPAWVRGVVNKVYQAILANPLELRVLAQKTPARKNKVRPLSARPGGFEHLVIEDVAVIPKQRGMGWAVLARKIKVGQSVLCNEIDAIRLRTALTRLGYKASWTTEGNKKRVGRVA